MLEELLKALGVATAAEAMAAISRFNNMFDEVCQMTGAQSSGEALEAVRRQHRFVQSIEQCAGMKGPEAIARMEAWKASAEQLRVSETTLAEMRAAQARTTADGLIEAAMRDKRLAPAMKEKAEGFFAEFGLKALETYLTSLPSLGIQDPNQHRQPAPPAPPSGAGGEGDWTADDAAYAKATGRSKEQVMAARKLWTETNGVIPNAHIEALNKAQALPRASAR